MDIVIDDLQTHSYNYYCPHCGLIIETLKSELQCKIFRHGAYINGLMQIDSHASKEVCDKLYADGLIYGCGKPYEIYSDNNILKIRICGYK
jgi:hypothetical protein